MAKYDGIRVIERGNRWQAWVRDSEAGRYVKKAFATKDEATTWSKSKSAAFEEGMEAAGQCSFERVIEDYMLKIARPGRNDRKKSPLHLANIRRILERAKAEAKITDLKDEDCADRAQTWIDTLTTVWKGQKTQRPAGFLSRRHYVCALKAVGKWAHSKAKYKLPRNPFGELELPEYELESRAHYEVKDLAKILADDNAFHPGYMIAALAIYAGLRAADIRHAQWSWIDWERNWIIVPANVSKTGRTRLVSLQRELLALLKVRRKDTGPIIDIDWGRYPTAKGADLVKDLLKQNGIIRTGRVLHDMRHAHGAMMHASGESLPIIMENMGHKTTEMSAFYGECAKHYKQQIEHECWPRGEIRLRRSPAPTTMTTTQAVVNA